MMRLMIPFLWLLVLILVSNLLSAAPEKSSAPGSGNTEEDNRHHKHRQHAKHHGSGHKIKRCGGRTHGKNARICNSNDTDCGVWDKDRYFHPHTCKYEDITPEQAMKCLGNRTLAFIGDSQIRDICMGVVYFLLGQKISEASENKFDNKGDMSKDGVLIEDIKVWSRNVPPHNRNGYVFPKPEVAEKEGYKWQVQMWNLYKNEFIHNDQVNDVLKNRFAGTNGLRKIDLAFWSHGLHDYGWWENPPYGENYYSTMVSKWLKLRDMSVPSVWVSMNPECKDKLSDTLTNQKRETQSAMVEDANFYVNQRLLGESIPYWDAASALRVPSRCDYSADGLHVKMFVDVMRAKMLFNHLCDAEMKWRLDPLQHFV